MTFKQTSSGWEEGGHQNTPVALWLLKKTTMIRENIDICRNLQLSMSFDFLMIPILIIQI